MFANIYLNKLDQFVKHQLKIKYYIRYTDDFVIVLDKTDNLQSLIPRIKNFLSQKLKLKLHPDKIITRKLRQGIDFLGYVVLPHYRVLRTRTKKRMLKRLNQKNLPSYLGLLKHCKGYKLANGIRELIYS